MTFDTTAMTERELTLFRLAESLRGEVVYMHDTGDVLDSIRNADGLLSEALDILGPVPEE